MRRLSTEKRATILHALCEGNSVNATARIAGASKITVLRLLADAGQFARDYHDVYVRNLASKRVQADEIWSFCGCKDKAKKAGAAGHGRVWTRGGDGRRQVTDCLPGSKWGRLKVSHHRHNELSKWSTIV